MNVIFHTKPGEIYDIFLSLWLANNFEYASEEKKEYGITKDTIFEEKIKTLRTNKKINLKNLERYFHKEIEPSEILSFAGMWNNPNLDRYLEFLRNTDDLKIRKSIIKLVMSKEIDECENEDDIEKMALNNAAVLDYIDDKNINVELKWEIFRLLTNKQKYFDDFTQFINEYSDTYKILHKERKKELDKFNVDFKRNIEEHGVTYLKEFTNNFIDFDKYENIYISSSLPIGIVVDMKPEEKSCYVIVGPRTKDIVKGTAGKSELEKNIIVLKNISDNTRFQIMKKLVNRDYYGLEIAKAFGISKTAVSRHMDFLLLTGVVRVERKEHKAYYSLDKNVLRKTVQFLTKEFKL